MGSKDWQLLSLVGIIWLQSVNGTNFNFPSYSSELKHQLSLSQVELNSLAFAYDAGKLFGFLSGLAANYLPLPVVLLIGSVLGFVGYGGQYLFITNQLHLSSYWIIFFLSVLAGNSFCWINTGCNIVAVQNFSSYRHVAVGISTSCQGLSAMIYTNIVDSISSNAPEKFLLLNSVLPLGTCILVCLLARVVKVKEEQGGLKVGFFVIVLITIATGIMAVGTRVPLISKRLSPLSELVGILVFLILPLLVAVAERVNESVRKNENENENDGAEDVERSRPQNEVKFERQSGDEMEKGEEIGAVEMVKKLNFWLYFGVYLFGPTLGFVFLNNLGQIAETRGIYNVSSLVSLSSSLTFFGRLMPSLVECFFSRSKYMKWRPGWLVVLMGPMCIGFFLLLCPTHWSLHASTAVTGLCTGAITTIAVSLTVDLFGKTNFSINHNVVVANIPVGSLLNGFACFAYQWKMYGTRVLQNNFLHMGLLLLLWNYPRFHAISSNRKLRLYRIADGRKFNVEVNRVVF